MELIDTEDRSVAHGVDLIETGFDFDPARLTAAAEASHHEHPVSGPDHLLDRGLGPGFLPPSVVLPHRVEAVQRPLLQGDHHDVWVAEAHDLIEVATRVGIPNLAHNLDVLLRHRLRSIPTGLRARLRSPQSGNTTNQRPGVRSCTHSAPMASLAAVSSSRVQPRAFQGVEPLDNRQQCVLSIPRGVRRLTEPLAVLAHKRTDTQEPSKVSVLRSSNRERLRAAQYQGRTVKWGGTSAFCRRSGAGTPVTPAPYFRSAAASTASPYDSALALIASNSAWVIAPESSSSFALAISVAEPLAVSRTYWSIAAR